MECRKLRPRFLGTAARMTRGPISFLSRWAADLVRRFDAKRARVIRANLQRAFPDATHQRIESDLVRHYRAAIRSHLDRAYLCRLSSEQLIAACVNDVDIEGSHILEGLRTGANPIVFCSP